MRDRRHERARRLIAGETFVTARAARRPNLMQVVTSDVFECVRALTIASGAEGLSYTDADQG